MLLLCCTLLSDSLSKDLLSCGIYGNLIDFSIDNPSKVAQYIYNCRQMDISLLPPDINEGDAVFTVYDGAISMPFPL